MACSKRLVPRAALCRACGGMAEAWLTTSAADGSGGVSDLASRSFQRQLVSEHTCTSAGNLTPKNICCASTPTIKFYIASWIPVAFCLLIWVTMITGQNRPQQTWGCPGPTSTHSLRLQHECLPHLLHLSCIHPPYDRWEVLRRLVGEGARRLGE